MTRTFVSALVAIPCALWIGALAMRVMLAHAPAIAATGLAQPLPVVTGWGPFGTACFGVLVAALGLAATALFVALKALPAGGLHRAWIPVTIAAAVALAGAVAWPCTFSSDPYAYAAYGAEAARGLDPYRPLAAGVGGATFAAARFQWGGSFPACVYGPAFVAFADGVWRLTNGGGPGAPILFLRWSAIAAFLASIPILDAALEGVRPRRRSAILCAYGLHPVALWSVAEGHNDAFVLFAAACAAALLRRGLPLGAGALLGASAAIKAPGAFFAFGFGLDAIFVQRRTAGALGAALGFGLAALVSVPPLLGVAAAARVHGRVDPEISLTGLLGAAPAIVVAAILALLGFARTVRGSRSGMAWFGLAAAAALPNVYPWYALWLMPLALCAPESGGVSAALYGVTISLVVRYLPDAAGTLPAADARIATVAALLPLLLGAPGVASTLLRPPFAGRKT